MAKQLTFTYNGKDYVLEYTRNTVRQMENNGFIANDIETKPMTVLPALFNGVQYAHYGNTAKPVWKAWLSTVHLSASHQTRFGRPKPNAPQRVTSRKAA